MFEKHVPAGDMIVPPCSENCPAGVDVPRYIRAVKNRKYDEAVAVLREKLALPMVCADAWWICKKPGCAIKIGY